MDAGATPGNVHKQLLNNAPLPISSADVPSLSQLKNWKHANSVRDMPSGMVLFLFLIYLLITYLSLNSGDVSIKITSTMEPSCSSTLLRRESFLPAVLDWISLPIAST